MGHSERVILFTRFPEAGRAKSRLVPHMGEEAAADLQRAMTEHVLVTMRRLALNRQTIWGPVQRRPGRFLLPRPHQTTLQVRVTGRRAVDFRRWLGEDLDVVDQGEGTLGPRMDRAFRASWRRGAARTLVVGADCPSNSEHVMDEALEALSDHDLVLGPAVDGGYYQIGMGRPIPELFEDVPWGSGRVLERTLEVARRLHLRVHLTESLSDVDRVEDLDAWHAVRDGRESLHTAPWLTIVIPASNEASTIGWSLASLASEAGTEVVVVDGASEDATAAVARSHGATVVSATDGRAGQANAGALHGTASTLLFLHADTVLLPGATGVIDEALTQPGVSGGAFRLAIFTEKPGIEVIEWLIHFRSTVLQMPYGDQGIFLRRRIFEQVGPYPPLPIMEDFEFMRRLGRHGRVVTADPPALTSSRRWDRLGLLRTTLINQMMIAGYLVGLSPERLMRFYRLDHRDD